MRSFPSSLLCCGPQTIRWAVDSLESDLAQSEARLGRVDVLYSHLGERVIRPTLDYLACLVIWIARRHCQPVQCLPVPVLLAGGWVTELESTPELLWMRHLVAAITDERARASTSLPSLTLGMLLAVSSLPTEEALACLRDDRINRRLRELIAEGRVQLVGASISSAAVLSTALDEVTGSMPPRFPAAFSILHGQRPAIAT